MIEDLAYYGRAVKSARINTLRERLVQRISDYKNVKDRVATLEKEINETIAELKEME